VSNIRAFRRRKQREFEEQSRLAAQQVWDEMFDIDVGAPFDKDSSLWMCWLWPSEWRYLFAVAGALQEADLIARDQMSLQRVWIDAIAYLQRQCGLVLEGLHLADSGELFPKVKEPLAQANIYWIRLLQMMESNPELRLAPDVLRHVRFAIDLSPHRAPGLNLDVLKDFESLQSRNVRNVIDAADEIPDSMKAELIEVEKLRREFFQQHPHMKDEDFEL
jgi:hypothetical protein